MKSPHQVVVGLPARAINVVILLVLCGTSPAPADSPVFYSFTEIARTGAELTSFGRFPALNNDGFVAFHAETSGGTERILRSNGGPLTIIADTASAVFGQHLGNQPSINGKGDVAFSTHDRGVFKVVDGTTIEIANPFHFTGPFGRLDLFNDHVSLNENGTVLFGSYATDGASPIAVDRGMFMGSGGAVTAVRVESAGVPGPLGFNLNNNDDIAFLEIIRRGSGGGARSVVRIFVLTTAEPPSMSQIVDEEFDGFTSVSILWHTGTPSVNDSGVAAFDGRLENGVSGVFTSPGGPIGPGGPITTVADSAGQYDWLDFPAINNRGTVAFHAKLDAAGGTGIFVGPDPMRHRVIGTGDRIGERTVETATIGSEGLNDRDQVALHVRFTDGSTAIMRADPLGPTLPTDPSGTMQLSTGAGAGAGVSQAVPAPSEVATLSVDLRFLTPKGELALSVMGREVARITAPTMPAEKFSTTTMPIDVQGLRPGYKLPKQIPIDLDLVGPPGSTIQIRRVGFPGLRNGDFSQGSLDGWETRSRRGGAVTAVMALPVIKPYK